MALTIILPPLCSKAVHLIAQLSDSVPQEVKKLPASFLPAGDNIDQNLV